MSTLVGGSSHADHPIGSRVARGMAAAVVAAGLCLVTAGGVRWLYRASELQRFRTTLQGLTGTMRSIQPRAVAKHRPMLLRIDAAHGVFQVTSLQNGRRAYEIVEETVWLPQGLEISDAPASLAVSPTGHLTSATIVITAPSYSRLFRLTTTPRGAVQLDEEPTT